MKHLLIIAFIGISAPFFGQTTILSEDFNDGFPSGWQLIDNDGLTPNESAAVNFIDDAYVIHEDYDTIGMGDSVLIATSWFDTIGESDDWLILPNLTLGDMGNYLSFDAKSIDESYPDGLEIRVSVGTPDIWNFFTMEVAYANVAMDPDWTNYTVSLDSLGLANESVFIAFRHISTDNYILALDNIKVHIDDPVSVVEENASMSIYPNPSDNGFFYIGGSINATYKVFDISGKTVKTGLLSTNQIDLSFLDAGSYFIQLDTESSPKKLVIR